MEGNAGQIHNFHFCRGWIRNWCSPSKRGLAKVPSVKSTKAWITERSRWWPSKSSTSKRLRMRSRTSSKRYKSSANVILPLSPNTMAHTSRYIFRVTRSGDFSPKNATHFGYFPANLQKFWAIFGQINCWSVGYSSVKILILAFFWTFWLLLRTLSGSSVCITHVPVGHGGRVSSWVLQGFLSVQLVYII